MLEVAHMAVHAAQLTSLAAMRAAFEAVTTMPAAILGLEGYGIAPGNYADVVLLDARDPIEAIRLKATRLLVIRRGAVVARTPPRTTELHLADRPRHVTLRRWSD
jgi:cytosine deaminase